MKQKLLILLCVIMAAITASAYDFTYSYNGKTLYFNKTSESTCEVARNSYYSGDIVIPSSVEYSSKNYSVTSIGSDAFYYCSSLTSVEIPNSVTTIGSSAFYCCKGLTSVTIPTSVTSIGSRAFSGCSGLTSVEIPNSVISIGSSAFSGCSGLNSVEIPNSVTSIGSYAFSSCSGLISVEIPNSVTSIGSDAFKDCAKLNLVNITDLESWCRISFSNGTSNPLYYAHNLYLNGVIMENLLIPNTVTSIGNSAFSGCSGLKSVEIPNTVTSIGNSAFSGCSGLKSVIVGSPTISDYAFSSCSNMTSLTIQSGVKSIGKYAFGYCIGLTQVEIPSTVESIGDYCFGYCTSLEEISVPQSVNSFKPCFQGCTALKKFTGSAATTDGCALLLSNGQLVAYANYCGKTTFSIPAGSKILAEELFYGNNDLTEVYVPSSVTDIRSGVFSNCSALKKVTFASGSDQLYISIPYTYSGATFSTCPIECVVLGRNVAWKGVSSDSKYPFDGVKTLKQLTICDGVTALPEKLLYNCNKLPELTVPASVSSFGAYTVSNTNQLTMLHITPPTLTSNSILSWCKIFVPKQSLEAYKNAEYWTYRKDYINPIVEEGEVNYRFVHGGMRYEITDAQNHLCKLVNGGYEYPYDGEVTIPSRVYLNGVEYTPTDIDEYTFENNTTMTSLVLSDDITNFNANVSSTATSLENISVPETNPYLQSVGGVLYDKAVTRLVAFPPGLRGDYTTPATLEEFRLTNPYTGIVLPNIESITINDGVNGCVMIDKAANLKHMVVGDDMTGFRAYDCPKLEYLEIGTGIDMISGSHFYNTNNIKTLIIRDSENPLKVERKNLKDGYIAAFRSIKPQYFYLGRNLQAVGTPSMYHFATTLPMIEFGPKVTVVDGYLNYSISQSTKIVAPSYQHWATIYKGYYPYELPVHSFFTKDTDETVPDVLVLDNIPTIKSRAFYNVNNMPATVIIGAGVENIDEYAFNYPYMNDGGIKEFVLMSPVRVGKRGLSIATCTDFYTYITNPSDIKLDNEALYNMSNCTLHVPKGSKALYEAADQWKDFKNIEEIASISLTDGVAYAETKDRYCVDVNYTRTFSHSEWQPLYVPFNMSYEEWSEYADVAEVHNVRGYDRNNDGEIDDIVIEFNRLTSGEIVPNIPYVIRAKSTGTVTFECTGKTVLAAPEEEGTIECSSTKMTYSFRGVYQPKKDMYSSGAYHLSKGEFHQASSDAAVLSPNRFYLKVTPKTGGYNPSSLPHKIRMIVDGEEVESGIEDIEIDSPIDGIYYDLTGRQVKNPTRGIYIQNGNKVIIR